MEMLYFLFPVVAILATLVFAIRQISSGSSLRSNAEAPVPSGSPRHAPTRESTASLRAEERYVDWFTSDRNTRARDRAMSGSGDEALVGQAVMTGGMAYQPSETAPVANF